MQAYIDEEINNEELKKVFCAMVKEALRSKTAHAFYGSLSLKKRKEWHYNFLHDIKRFESVP